MNLWEEKTPNIFLYKEQSDEDRNNLKEILDAVDNFFSQINKSPDRASADLSLKLIWKKLKNGNTLDFETAGPVVTKILNNLREIKEQRDTKRDDIAYKEYMTYEDYNNRYKGAIKQKEINDKVSYTEDEFLTILKILWGVCSDSWGFR